MGDARACLLSRTPTGCCQAIFNSYNAERELFDEDAETTVEETVGLSRVRAAQLETWATEWSAAAEETDRQGAIVIVGMCICAIASDALVDPALNAAE